MSPIEGMEEQPDMPIPHCDKKECNNDNYILKTQIVPPVCPICPSFPSSNEETNKPDQMTQDKPYQMTQDKPYQMTQDNIEKVIEKEVEKNETNNYSLKKNINIDYGNENDIGNIFNKNKPPNQQSNQAIQQSNQAIQPNFQNGLFKSKPLNNTDLSQETKQIDELKKQIEDLKKNGGSCQPCPACERCPEPSFECKKVPNYRSNAIGQYLPIPVLNDFSSFSS